VKTDQYSFVVAHYEKESTDEILAFLAGIISFLSPCVLPLAPGYVPMLSGIGMEQLRAGQPARHSLFASSLAFVSGFSVVFSFGFPESSHF